MVHRLLYGRWCAAVLVISLYSVVPSMGGAAGPCDSAITTKDMVMCYDTQYAEAAKRLAELQEQVAGVLSDQAREALTTAQAKWVDFRKANCRSISLAYEGGSMEALAFYSCRLQMTADRVQELRAAFGELMQARPQ